MYCYGCRPSHQRSHGDVEMRGFKGREGEGRGGKRQEAENTHQMVGSGSIGWVLVMLAGYAACACLRSRRKAPPYDPLPTIWSREWVKREKDPDSDAPYVNAG